MSSLSSTATVTRYISTPQLAIYKLDKAQNCFIPVGSGNLISGSYLGGLLEADALFIATFARMVPEQEYGLFERDILWARFKYIKEGDYRFHPMLFLVGKVVGQGCRYFQPTASSDLFMISAQSEAFRVSYP